jgi:hypothetical protein
MINLGSSKTVLIISFAYPPLAAIGARRVSKISKELLAIGWTPIIVTATTSNELVTSEIEIPKELVYHVDWFDSWRWINMLEINFLGRIISKFLKKLIPYTTAGIPEFRRSRWINNAYKKALSLCKENKIDIIYSSFTPPASIRVAHKLNKKTNIPWVVEYRDLWTGNPYVRRNLIGTLINERFEKRLIRNACGLVTVSTPLAKNLYLLHDKPTAVVYNGYDDLDMDFESSDSNTFDILYTGVLYKGKRDPLALFKALRILKHNNGEVYRKVRVQFFGPGVSIVLKEVLLGFDDLDCVTYHESITHDMVVKKQREADLLLILGNNHPSDAGIVTGKLFEYMERRRPILALVYPEGAIAEILRDSNQGMVSNEPEIIANHIERLAIAKFTKAQKKIITPNPFYSRENQVKVLTEFLLKFIIK